MLSSFLVITCINSNLCIIVLICICFLSLSNIALYKFWVILYHFAGCGSVVILCTVVLHNSELMFGLYVLKIEILYLFGYFGVVSVVIYIPFLTL